MPKHVLGIEVTPQRLTAIQLTGTPKSYSVTAAVQHPLPQTLDAEEQITLHRQAVQEMVELHRLRADMVLTTLPSHKTILRNLTLPFKDTRRIRQTLKGALEEHMPLEPEDVIADFQLLPSRANNVTPLLVAAIPHDVIATHLSHFQDSGLDPAVIDLDAFALGNAVLFGSSSIEPTTVLIDLSPTRILITVLRHGLPVFIRSLTHSLSLDEASPEELADQINKHLQHTLYAYEHAVQEADQPDMFILSGAKRSHLTPLATALQQEIEQPVNVWQITSEHYKPSTTHIELEDQPEYATAFGAALRGLHRQANGLNFRREQFERHRDLQELRGRLIGLGVMLVLVAGLGLSSMYLENYFKTQQHLQLRRHTARIFQQALPNSRMVQPTFQLREEVRKLKERLDAFGGITGAKRSGLQILHEISTRIPPTILVNVDNLTITTNTTDLSGTTASYDNIVKLKDALEASPYFTTVKITNTKTDVENKVAFKFTITSARTLDNTP
ncbi:MAG: pilus assembly protein PilM [bacterium]|nr:pilus assembly protein PilM [bacterium]